MRVVDVDPVRISVIKSQGNGKKESEESEVKKLKIGTTC